MTYNHDNLPAIARPDGEKGKEIQPRGTDRHIIIETNESLSVAPIPEGKEELMQWRMRANLLSRKNPAEIGVGYALTLGTLAIETAPLIEAGMLLGGGALFFKVFFGSPIYNITKITKQKRVIKEAAEDERTINLSKKEFGVNIPSVLLEVPVLFQSENGVTEVPASELMQSIGTFAPGIRIIETTDDRVDCHIAPGRLVAQALALVSPDRHDHFLGTAAPSMQAMHEASQKLPPPGLLPNTPESMRQALEKPATDLLLGALGVYGVLRSEVSPVIATKTREFYATQDENHQAILEDAVRLQFPTPNNIPWQEIMNFRQQVGEV